MSAAKNVSDTVYTKSALKPYDKMLKFFSGNFWGCPVETAIEHYNKNITGNHLDVGVGTGYFLDVCRFPVSNPRLVLMDSNMEPLELAKERLARYSPSIVQANILEPIAYEGEKFDSVALNHVVHCLPGTMEDKGQAFGHLRALLNDNGVFFGATVLGRGVKHNFMGAAWLNYCNKKGVLDNHRDDCEGLEAALSAHFSKVSVQVIGRTALFRGRV